MVLKLKKKKLKFALIVLLKQFFGKLIVHRFQNNFFFQSTLKGIPKLKTNF